jgi:RNase P subunit RPR2
MAMVKCPHCLIILSDVDLYYNVGGRHGRQTIIKCPNCGEKYKFGDQFSKKTKR